MNIVPTPRKSRYYDEGNVWLRSLVTRVLSVKWDIHKYGYAGTFLPRFKSFRHAGYRVWKLHFGNSLYFVFIF